MNETNGRGASGANGAGGEHDPFAAGIWVLTTIDGSAALILVDESLGAEEATQKSMLKQLKENGFARVDATMKYLLKEILFPMPEMSANGQRTGKLLSASLPSVTRHETSIDLQYPFVSHLTLSSLTFLQEMHEEDVDKLRLSVKNADEAAEANARLARSNLITPSAGAGYLRGVP